MGEIGNPTMKIRKEELPFKQAVGFGGVVVLTAAVPAIEAILRGILYWCGGEWKAAGPAFREECEKILGTDAGALRDLRALRSGKGSTSRDAVIDLYARTMRLLEGLSEKIENEGGGS